MAQKKKRLIPIAPESEPIREPEREQAPDSGEPKTKRNGKAINVWIPDDLYSAFQAFRDAQRVKPRITDTVELSLQEFLQKEGFWPKSES